MWAELPAVPARTSVSWRRGSASRAFVLASPWQRHWALRVLGILIIIPHGGVGVGLIVLLAAGLARGEPQAAAGVAAMLLVVAYCAVPVLIGLALIGGSRKVWRCRSCGAVVPRA